MAAKKSAPKVVVFFNPDLRQDPCGALSADRIRQAACIMLASLRIKSANLSLIFVTGRTMRRINRAHLGHDFVTDVVTFDLHDQDSTGMDGELVICPAEALRNARALGEPLEREVLRYVAHGILHLFGHDDATARARAAMRREEDELLARLWP